MEGLVKLFCLAVLLAGCTGAAVFADDPRPVARPKLQVTGPELSTDAGMEDSGLEPVRK